MSDDDQAQSRNYLEESVDNKKKKNYNKSSYYNQEETLFLIWENGSAPVGETKSFFRYGKHRFYEKTESGCVELSAKQYEERINDNASSIDDRAKNETGKTSNNDGSRTEGALGDIVSNKYNGETSVISRQALGEELRYDAGGSISSVRGDDNRTSIEDDQNQSRTGTL